MDRHHSNLNGTVFGTRYWSECLRGQAATYRKFAEQADDPVVKRNLLELTSDCEEVANNIEDHLTGGERRAPRSPFSTGKKRHEPRFSTNFPHGHTRWKIFVPHSCAEHFFFHR